MVLDSKSVVDNIYKLAKLRGVKISTLEECAGVGAGYFSRFRKDKDDSEVDKNRSLPSTEVLSAIADKLGTTIDILINLDFTNLKDAELTIITFLDCLAIATEENKYIWQADTFKKMLETPTYCYMRDFPLRRIYKEDYPTGGQYKRSSFYSLFLEEDVALEGKIYRLTHKGTTYILVKVSLEDYSNLNPLERACTSYYELYAVKNAQMKKITSVEILSSETTISPMITAFTNLYSAASKSAELNPECDNIVDTINDLMKVFDFTKD